MKIIQITDPHLLAAGTINGTDPLARLEACLADIALHHQDADLLVISGDLTDHGERAAYAALHERLRRLGLPCRLLLGNHDDRQAFRDAFPDAPVDPSGFVQSSLDAPEARLIFLDSLDEGHVTGRLCPKRLSWLERQLNEAGNRPVLLFMHHPPFPIGVPALDPHVLVAEDAAALSALVRRHGDVRQIFAGHVHRPAHGIWNGVPVTTLPGTNHQMPLDFRAPSARPVDEPPGYAVILLGMDSLIVHLRNFPVPGAIVTHD